MIGYAVSTVVVPVFTWMIHTYFVELQDSSLERLILEAWREADEETRKIVLENLKIDQTS